MVLPSVSRSDRISAAAGGPNSPWSSSSPPAWEHVEAQRRTWGLCWGWAGRICRPQWCSGSKTSLDRPGLSYHQGEPSVCRWEILETGDWGTREETFTSQMLSSPLDSNNWVLSHWHCWRKAEIWDSDSQNINYIKNLLSLVNRLRLLNPIYYCVLHCFTLLETIITRCRQCQ